MDSGGLMLINLKNIILMNNVSITFHLMQGVLSLWDLTHPWLFFVQLWGIGIYLVHLRHLRVTMVKAGIT